MTQTLWVALGVAALTGVSLGVQATVTSWVGTLLGPPRTGLLIIAVGGVVALAGYAIFAGALGPASAGAIRRAAPGLVAAGTLAVVAVAGTAFALPRSGVAAGLAAIIFGQMLVALVVDTAGLGGMTRIPFSLTRVAGLATLALALWLLAPRGG